MLALDGNPLLMPFRNKVDAPVRGETATFFDDGKTVSPQRLSDHDLEFTPPQLPQGFEIAGAVESFSAVALTFARNQAQTKSDSKTDKHGDSYVPD